MSTVEELLTPTKKRFLILSNYIIGIMIALDLLHLTNVLIMPLEYFALFNLIVLGASLLNYKIKRDINTRLRENKESS